MIAAVAGLTLLLAAIAESVCERWDAHRYPPPGAMAKVGPRRLHMQCLGAGRPTIVLEAGLGDDSTVWDAVFHRLSVLRRTCRYDRAGLGWSEDRGAVHTPDEAVDDLAGALAERAERGPYVLVGHSFGGLIARLFAARHPKSVVGLVLLDAAHEDQFRPPYGLPSEIAGWRTDPKPWLASFGVLRVIAALHPPADAVGPAERALRLRADRYWTVRAYSRGMSAFEAAARRAPPLGALPLVVVTAAAKPRQYWPAWRALQDRLAALSYCSAHWIVAKSRHYIQIDDPSTVVKAVDWTLKVQCSARSELPTASPLASRSIKNSRGSPETSCVDPQLRGPQPP